MSYPEAQVLLHCQQKVVRDQMDQPVLSKHQNMHVGPPLSFRIKYLLCVMCTLLRAKNIFLFVISFLPSGGESVSGDSLSSTEIFRGGAAILPGPGDCIHRKDIAVSCYFSSRMPLLDTFF